MKQNREQKKREKKPYLKKQKNYIFLKGKKLKKKKNRKTL